MQVRYRAHLTCGEPYGRRDDLTFAYSSGKNLRQGTICLSNAKTMRYNEAGLFAVLCCANTVYKHSKPLREHRII